MNAAKTVGGMIAASGPLPIRVGFWSALAIVVSFAVFTLCFVAILLTSPPFFWEDLPGYLAYVAEHDQLFQNLARLAMLLFGPLFVLLLASIHELARGEKRFMARISICFGLMFATLTGVNYFVQLTAVRMSILSGHTSGLDQIVQGNPYSAMSAMNMLGWSLFLGLSSLFIAPVFSRAKLERLIGVSFLLNGVFCLLGGIGYLMDIAVLVFLTVNFGMGGAVLVAATSLCLLFRRMEGSIAVEIERKG